MKPTSGKCLHCRLSWLCLMKCKIVLHITYLCGISNIRNPSLVHKGAILPCVRYWTTCWNRNNIGCMYFSFFFFYNVTLVYWDHSIPKRLQRNWWLTHHGNLTNSLCVCLLKGIGINLIWIKMSQGVSPKHWTCKSNGF